LHAVEAGEMGIEVQDIDLSQPLNDTQQDELKKKFRNLEMATQDALHPVVIKHPLSGRPALYVNPDFTLRFEGMSEFESRPLLEELYEHSVQAEFVCRFKWRQGSIAFWDNRATMHSAANDYHGQARLMHRITLRGVTLEPASPKGIADVMAS